MHELKDLPNWVMFRVVRVRWLGVRVSVSIIGAASAFGLVV